MLWIVQVDNSADVVKCTLKKCWVIFEPKCWVQPVGSFYWVVLFYIFTQVLGNCFNLNAGFSLLGNFIGLFVIFFTQVLGSFSVTKVLGHF